MKKWDVFISHASEDKEKVALPLTDALRKAGLKVWLDRQELRLGDSLREKIDEGLAESRFGVVILSRSFLAKGWPKRELNGLMALEEDGRKVILPVWHEITKTELAGYSPTLADRFAANTADGIAKTTKEILAVVLEDSDTPSVIAPTPARLLDELLSQNAPADRIKSLLSALTQPMLDAGRHGRAHFIFTDVRIGHVVVTFILDTVRGTEAIEYVTLVGLSDSSGPLLDSREHIADDVARELSTLESAHKELAHTSLWPFVRDQIDPNHQPYGVESYGTVSYTHLTLPTILRV